MTEKKIIEEGIKAEQLDARISSTVSADTPTATAPEEKHSKVTKKSKASIPELKLFDRWDSNIEVLDMGLRGYINLKSRLLPRSAGALQKHRFYKSRMHIVERLTLHLLVSGHQGRKHRLTSGRFGGGYITALKAVENGLEIIQKKENKNPIEVLVRAVENAALREEIMTYQMGSIVARDSVISAPQRRVDKVLRSFAQGIYRKTFGKNSSLSEAIAQEIIAAYKSSTDSFAIKEKDRVEREALGTR